jgi:DNA-binding transcriptional regulator LsrR (DeoR family)
MADNETSLDPATVAAAYYALPPSKRFYKELLDHFHLPPGKTSTNKLGRLVNDWEERGLIRHEVLREKAEFLPRNPRLEDQMRYRFGLRQAVVVDISSLEMPESPPQQDAGPWARYDDDIHERLGAWAGRLITSCIRSADTIATGGGRGPHFAVAQSNFSTAHRYSGDIYPLTG